VLTMPQQEYIKHYYYSENPGQFGQRYHVTPGDQNQQPIFG